VEAINSILKELYTKTKEGRAVIKQARLCVQQLQKASNVLLKPIKRKRQWKP